ncbi:DUF4011 domain-containing protein [Leisingera sp. ANG-Vp]|uniref:DUF4011 domain-containing protein n=1 Tax=Leisingera sp. ANG-Vp TaxID=1577896 RepID=UPI00068E9F71|nr:DUF4011 domain-containing protein [Leisingera sp. ANG-Vp]
MPNTTYTETSDDPLSSPEIIQLAADRLEELRKRLLDSSRSNPLINIKFKPNSTNVLRVVDELPDILRYNLTNGTAMRLVSLPPLEEELPDEQTDDFLDALHLARNEDQTYLDELEALDPGSKSYAEEELKIERALKDRVRAALGLPERQTKESPSLAEHARAHGISPGFALPYPEDEHEDGRHNDTDIQTLMLPDKLSRVAKGLLEKGRGFERETGVNVLHAAFGFLEWKNPGEREKYVSPLLLLEIRIERKKSPQGAQFKICGEGRVLVNTTLKQKLAAEHRLELPGYESGSIEEYFAEVSKAAPKGWDWKVRREVAFGIFPSSKIAMYHDLDPTRRPLAENPVVKSLLVTTGSGESAYADVYGTDTPEVARKVPHLVMDADASQFSALVDVANGEHLSIEGPPGSGKSQTIVNLIAAALAGGKKVLFVAEKLTALDVVRNRLEAVELGEFILPLQAGRGTRDKVYQSLEERLGVERPDDRVRCNFASRQDALERRRQSLQDYLNALGADFGTSGYSVYDIIGHGIATSEIREQIPREVRRIRLASPEAFNSAQIDALVADAEAFAERLRKISRMPRLWLDARAAILNRDDAEDTCELAGRLADSLDTFERDARGSELAPLLGASVFEVDLASLEALLTAMTEYGDSLDPALVETLSDPVRRRSVRDLCGQVQERQTVVARLSRALPDPEGWNLNSRLHEAKEFAARNSAVLDPAAHRERIAQSEDRLCWTARVLDAARALPADWAKSTRKPLSELKEDVARILDTSGAVLELRKKDPMRQVGAAVAQFQIRHAKLSASLGRIRQALPHADQHDPAIVRQAGRTIADAGVFRFMSSAYKIARSVYVDTLGGKVGETREAMAGRLRAYADWLEERRAFEADETFKAVFGEHFRGLATTPAMISEIGSFYATCTEIAGEDEALRASLEGGDIADLEHLAALVHVPEQSLEELVREEAALREEFDLEKTRLHEAEGHITLFGKRETVPLDEINETLLLKRRETELTEAIEVSPASAIIGDRFRGVSTQTDTLTLECSLAETLVAAPDPGLAISILKSGRASALLGLLSELREQHDAISIEAAAFCERLDLPEEARGAAALAVRADDLRHAAGDPSSLMERARLRRSEATLREQGFGTLVDWVLQEGAAFDPKRLGPISRAIIAKAMADRAFEIYADHLQGYDGEDFDRIRAEIAEKDRELIAMSREVVRSQLIADARPPAGINVGPKSQFSNMSLIRNEMGKKRNRIGVRDLTRRAGRALLELKPCWMMSPLAVAQYLHDGLTFDLVVIDEASQMTPENAVGALSRGHQAVVVGDTKQLPPTSFFKKMLDESDTDEDLREDSESILDMANMTFRPVRQLRWHYRSRHSALITFSNEWMYDGKLTIFPSARENDSEFGVHLVETSGTYRGKTNETEARAVVAAVLRHMREYPKLSLGVCTMNTDQKELILEEFERERERNPHVEDYVRNWEERNDALEEFFVKNLETIQGDERDVMFISTLYGPEKAGGRPHQRFGPINSSHGHRRLNVLFTRAKRKIVTFTSLKPTDILVDEGKNRGVHMFRAWLEYCGSGRVPDRARSGGETESPFEDYVAKQIEAIGCEAVPQVGAAGYRIDIGVRHPDWPYGYILGVECDGASYHSSKSSRDRDRLRQEVLEDLGWHFHRIWSTDWFNDTRTQVERLREAINVALERAKASDFPRSRVEKDSPVALLTQIAEEPESAANSLTSRRKAVQENLFQDELFNRMQGDTEGDAVANSVDKDPEISAATRMAPESVVTMIGLGSHVRIENLSEEGRKLAFTLVKEGNDLENGQVGVHTPLGQALIDAQVGDEVEYQVGVQIKEVRVLEIN